MINHFGAVQLRVTGSGNLKSRLYSLPNSAGTQVTEDLANLAMATAYREPVLISNMLQERAQLKVWVEELDEYFHIREINIFAKPTYTSDPQ